MGACSLLRLTLSRLRVAGLATLFLLVCVLLVGVWSPEISIRIGVYMDAVSKRSLATMVLRDFKGVQLTVLFAM